MNSPVRVLIVDDSALVRKILSDQLNRHRDIEVVGTAQDGIFVLNKIQQLKPDVVTLDVEMRNKGGLDILPDIMNQFNLPVIMVSAHTERGAEATFRALELGAVDFVTKPQALGPGSVEEIIDKLIQKIIAVGKSKNCNRIKGIQSTTSKPLTNLSKLKSSLKPARGNLTLDLIAIGASTGGTEAIKEVLVHLPDNLPGIVIVQHMPPGFTKVFANRLNTLCQIQVKEAEDGDEIMPGTALIAPGSHHMEVVRKSMRLQVRLLETPPVNRHRPSVDVLYFSAAQCVGNRCLGILLTGMGADGAVGLNELYKKGAFTMAQDESSCVVFGMPKEAIKLGGVNQVLPLQEIAPTLLSLVAPTQTRNHVMMTR